MGLDCPGDPRRRMIYFSGVDVVLKLARCGFLPLLPELLGVAPDEVCIRYLASLRSRLSRPTKKLTNADHQRHLAEFCQAHAVIDVAADLTRLEELLASGMDVGEAILFAEAEATGGVVVTGDKRALLAYARVSTKSQRSKVRVVCWEHLLLRVHALRGYATLRQGCCGALGEDGLLSLAFSSGLATEEGHAIAAIESYLRGVEQHSGDILAELDP